MKTGDNPANEDMSTIATFMGYELVTVNYVGSEEETQWQKDNAALLDEIGLESTGIYWVNKQTKDWFEIGEVDFKKWNELMPVVARIRELLQDYSLRERGQYLWDFICGTLSTVEISAIHIAVIRFIHWYNSEGEEVKQKPKLTNMSAHNHDETLKGRFGNPIKIQDPQQSPQQSNRAKWDTILSDAIVLTEGSIVPYDRILKYLSDHYKIDKA
jgi:hypothetical protein